MIYTVSEMVCLISVLEDLHNNNCKKLTIIKTLFELNIIIYSMKVIKFKNRGDLQMGIVGFIELFYLFLLTNNKFICGLTKLLQTTNFKL